MGYGAAAHVSFVYMLYHMDVIRVPKEETFSKKYTAEEVRLLTIEAYQQSLSTMSNMDRQLSRQKLVKNLSNENINTGVPVVFKTKRELKCKNELFLMYHFSGNTSLYVFITY